MPTLKRKSGGGTAFAVCGKATRQIIAKLARARRSCGDLLNFIDRSYFGVISFGIISGYVFQATDIVNGLIQLAPAVLAYY